MKKTILYLSLSLLAFQNVSIAGGVGDILGAEPVVSPDWDAKIYPNPNEGVFSIMVSGSSAALNVLVFNVIGEKVYELPILGDHGAKIDLSNLEKGLYVVQIVDEKRGEVRTLRMQVK
jgi:hypothetical protein